jgi:hypothetical protein
MVSCSHHGNSGQPRESKETYSYSDVSGSFTFQREVKPIKKKLVTRTQIMLPSGGAKVVEKAVTVSQIGTIRDGGGRTLVVRPLASEFTVWLEGNRYSSRMELNPAKRSMRVSLSSPDPRWRGVTEVPFPRGKHFCFYSQIPECLNHNRMLSRAVENKKKTFDFYVIWDNYPYVQEQLTNVGKTLFSSATVRYDGELKGRFRYIIDMGDQVLLYQFTKDFELAGFSWIAQGITLARPGEEAKIEEE